MVLMAAQMTTFFKDDEQMGIPHAMEIQLQTDRIMTVGDLADFEKDSLQLQYCSGDLADFEKDSLQLQNCLCRFDNF